MYCTWKNTKCGKSKTIISTLKNRLNIKSIVEVSDLSNKRGVSLIEDPSLFWHLQKHWPLRKQRVNIAVRSSMKNTTSDRRNNFAKMLHALDWLHLQHDLTSQTKGSHMMRCQQHNRFPELDLCCMSRRKLTPPLSHLLNWNNAFLHWFGIPIQNHGRFGHFQTSQLSQSFLQCSRNGAVPPLDFRNKNG